jgi:hypothetical protein
LLGALVVRFLHSGAAKVRQGRAGAATPRASSEVISLPLESSRLLWCLGLLGFVSQLATTVNALVSSPIPLLQRLSGEGLQMARLMNIALGQGYDFGVHSRLAIFGAAAFVFVCMVAGGCLARAGLSRKSWLILRWLAFGCAFLIAFNGLFIRGGRMELVLLASGVSLALLMDEERRVLGAVRRRLAQASWMFTASMWVLAIVVVGYLSTGFTKDRIGTAGAYTALEAYHRTAPARWLEVATQDNEDLEFALLNLSYLPVPLTSFAYFYDLHDERFPGPFWGQYNLTGPVTFVMRRMGLRDEQQTLQDIRQEATRDLRLHGFGDNVWSTAYRDIALDFGWSGVPVVMAILGGLAQLLFLKAGRERGGVFLALAPLTVLFMLFTLAHSLVVLESVAVGFYMCFAVLLVQAFTHMPRVGRRAGKGAGKASGNGPAMQRPASGAQLAK